MKELVEYMVICQITKKIPLLSTHIFGVVDNITCSNLVVGGCNYYDILALAQSVSSLHSA